MSVTTPEPYVDPKWGKIQELEVALDALLVEDATLSDAKQLTVELFRAHPVIADLQPSRWFREAHAPAEKLAEALDAAADRITRRREIAERIGPFLGALNSFASDIKGAAARYLQQNFAYQARRIRVSHTPSDKLKQAIEDALKTLPKTGGTELQQAQRKALLAHHTAVDANLRAKQARTRDTARDTAIAEARRAIGIHFPNLLPSRVTFSDGADACRAVLAEMHGLLTGLESPAADRLLAEIAAHKTRIQRRKQIEGLRTKLKRQQTALSDAFASNAGHVQDFVKVLADKRRQAAAEAAEAYAALEALDRQVRAVEEPIEALESKTSALTAAEEEELIDLREQREELLAERVTSLREVRAALEKRDRIFDELDQLQLFAFDKLDEIKLYQAKIKQLFKDQKEKRAFVFYLELTADFVDRLEVIAELVKGAEDTDVEATGKMAVFLVIEVGVKAGVDLGFASLEAKVAVSLLVGGQLAVLEGQKFVFGYDVQLLLSAGVTADLAKLGQNETGPIGSLPVPADVLSASASASLTLVDYRGRDLYDDSHHWASVWASRLARRVAWLRGYRAGSTAPTGIETALRAKAAETSDDAVEKKNIARAKELVKLIDAAKKEPVTVSLSGQEWVRASFEVGGLELAEHQTKESSYRVTTVSGSTTRTFKLQEWSDQAQLAIALGSTRTGTSGMVRDKLDEQTVEATTTLHSVVADGGEVLRRYFEVSYMTSRSASVEVEGELGEIGARFKSADLPDLRRDPAALHAAGRGLWPATLPTTDPKLLDRMFTSAAPAGVVTDRTALRKRCDTAMRALLGLASIGTAEKLASYGWKAIDNGETIKAKLEGLGEQDPSTVASLASSVARSIPGLSEAVAGLATVDRMLAPFELNLQKTGAGTIRLVTQPRPDGVRWTQAWTPEVFRPLAVTSGSFAVKVSWPVVPLVSIFFGMTLRFQRSRSAAELLGTDTLVYLRKMHQAFARSEGDRWKSYWIAHYFEILEICRNVATPGTGAHWEVVHLAATHGGAARAKARAFGAACWKLWQADAELPAPFGGPSAHVSDKGFAVHIAKVGNGTLPTLLSELPARLKDRTLATTLKAAGAVPADARTERDAYLTLVAADERALGDRGWAAKSDADKRSAMIGMCALRLEALRKLERKVRGKLMAPALDVTKLRSLRASLAETRMLTEEQFKTKTSIRLAIRSKSTENLDAEIKKFHQLFGVLKADPRWSDFDRLLGRTPVPILEATLKLLELAAMRSGVQQVLIDGVAVWKRSGSRANTREEDLASTSKRYALVSEHMEKPSTKEAAEVDVWLREALLLALSTQLPVLEKQLKALLGWDLYWFDPNQAPALMDTLGELFAELPDDDAIDALLHGRLLGGDWPDVPKPSTLATLKDLKDERAAKKATVPLTPTAPSSSPPSPPNSLLATGPKTTGPSPLLQKKTPP